MLSLHYLALALLSTLTHAAVLPPQVRSAPVLTVNQLLAISPKSATCAGAEFPAQCRTAAQAVPAIVSSFATYGITSPAEMAAVVSIMAFESGDFKYNINYTPGNPGQGTRNMQSAAMNLLYASSIPALSPSLHTVTGGATSVVSLVVSQQNNVRGLLNANDTYDFGSGAWHLATQCSQSVRSTLQEGGQVGWEKYITACVKTTATEQRIAYWQRGMDAFGAC